jgi:hypothetical protein
MSIRQVLLTAWIDYRWAIERRDPVTAARYFVGFAVVAAGLALLLAPFGLGWSLALFVVQVCALAGVNRATLYKWQANEAFAAALREAEAEAVAALSRALAGLGDAAAAALRDALGPGQKITVRLRAAEIVTDRLLKIRELVSLEERLAALEGKPTSES